jgi:hypothetical protein
MAVVVAERQRPDAQAGGRVGGHRDRGDRPVPTDEVVADRERRVAEVLDAAREVPPRARRADGDRAGPDAETEGARPFGLVGRDHLGGHGPGALRAHAPSSA